MPFKLETLFQFGKQAIYYKCSNYWLQAMFQVVQLFSKGFMSNLSTGQKEWICSCIVFFKSNTLRSFGTVIQHVF